MEHYGTSGVSEMEKYGEKSFLLNLGHEISVMDLRSRKVCKVLDLSETENTRDNSSLAVNPTNNNIVSVCLDLTNSSHVVNFLPGSFCQSQWSPHSAKQFLTVNRESYIVDVYCSSDLSTPTLSMDINENQSPRGIFWNPWDESSLLLSDPSDALSRYFYLLKCEYSGSQGLSSFLLPWRTCNGL